MRCKRCWCETSSGQQIRHKSMLRKSGMHQVLIDLELPLCFSCAREQAKRMDNRKAVMDEADEIIRRIRKQCKVEGDTD